MTTDTEVKPLTAEQAYDFLWNEYFDADQVFCLAMEAIADGRHEVIDTETHEAVECGELERLRADARLGALVRKKMTSGNDIPVPGCVIKRTEFDAAQQEQEQ